MQKLNLPEVPQTKITDNKISIDRSKVKTGKKYVTTWNRVDGTEITLIKSRTNTRHRLLSYSPYRINFLDTLSKCIIVYPPSKCRRFEIFKYDKDKQHAYFDQKEIESNNGYVPQSIIEDSYYDDLFKTFPEWLTYDESNQGYFDSRTGELIEDTLSLQKSRKDFTQEEQAEIIKKNLHDKNFYEDGRSKPIRAMAFYNRDLQIGKDFMTMDFWTEKPCNENSVRFKLQTCDRSADSDYEFYQVISYLEAIFDPQFDTYKMVSTGVNNFLIYLIVVDFDFEIPVELIPYIMTAIRIRCNEINIPDPNYLNHNVEIKNTETGKVSLHFQIGWFLDKPIDRETEEGRRFYNNLIKTLARLFTLKCYDNQNTHKYFNIRATEFENIYDDNNSLIYGDVGYSGKYVRKPNRFGIAPGDSLNEIDTYYFDNTDPYRRVSVEQFMTSAIIKEGNIKSQKIRDKKAKKEKEVKVSKGYRDPIYKRSNNYEINQAKSNLIKKFNVRITGSSCFKELTDIEKKYDKKFIRWDLLLVSRHDSVVFSLEKLLFFCKRNNIQLTDNEINSIASNISKLSGIVKNDTELEDKELERAINKATNYIDNNWDKINPSNSECNNINTSAALITKNRNKQVKVLFVKTLRRQGLTYEEISSITNLSTTTIWRYLKEDIDIAMAVLSEAIRDMENKTRNFDRCYEGGKYDHLSTEHLNYIKNSVNINKNRLESYYIAADLCLLINNNHKDTLNLHNKESGKINRLIKEDKVIEAIKILVEAYNKTRVINNELSLYRKENQENKIILIA